MSMEVIVDVAARRNNQYFGGRHTIFAIFLKLNLLSLMEEIPVLNRKYKILE